VAGVIGKIMSNRTDAPWHKIIGFGMGG